jgi:chromosome segregation ATPase
MPPMPEPTRNRKRGRLWLSILASAAILAVAGVTIDRELRVVRGQAAQLELRARENDELRRRIDQLARAQGVQPLAQSSGLPPRLKAPSTPAAGAEALAAAEQETGRLRESLAQSNTEAAQLHARISGLESQTENLAAQNRRLTAAGEELKKSLADSTQTIELIRAELKTNSSRIEQLETANARLQEESSSAKQSGGQMHQVVSDLEGVFRRREMYLNNILRRYRDVTEQYRALSGVLDSRRDRQAAPMSGNEISRIQNTIAMAEEDLKQIQALNAQAQRLEKKLAAK